MAHEESVKRRRPVFKKLLIANRGEIACRIMRTAARMGIQTVGVYSEADAHAPHVALADEVYTLKGVSSLDTYLNFQQLRRVIVASGAQAVHPGYGFLSENPEFARACASLGVVFVGPTPDVIELMGSKQLAKEAAAQAGVPLIPGFHGNNQDPHFLAEKAQAIGYPVMIKAVMGGGGKGMRAVFDGNDFFSALSACQREAQSAFGDDRMMLEKLIVNPRHIEVQVFGDTHGHVVHLYERDCSLQRRHQKVVEEAPAALLSPLLRQQMLEAAVALAQSVNYTGAGTVEFLCQPSGHFYFMEMNTRLQVEHPVTEMITGQDLVEWQLRVANGEPLPLSQSEIHCHGHAIEARIYAEDTAKQFMPSAGKLLHVSFGEGEGIRTDSGIQVGQEIGVHYDPMLAKQITWGVNRSQALSRMKRAIEKTAIFGLMTNTAFLQALLSDPLVCVGQHDTSFLDQELPKILPSEEPSSLGVAIAAVLMEKGPVPREGSLLRRKTESSLSPWEKRDSFRLNHRAEFSRRIAIGEWEFQLHIAQQGDQFSVAIDNAEPVTIQLEQLHATEAIVTVQEKRMTVSFTEQKGLFWFQIEGKIIRAARMYDGRDSAAAPEDGGHCRAPLPGKITKVWCHKGGAVTKGDPLVTLEAMKMEHTLKANQDAVIASVFVQLGAVVSEGDVLLDYVISQENVP